MKQIKKELLDKQAYFENMRNIATKSLESNMQKGRLQVSYSNGTTQYYVRGEEEKGKGRYLRKDQRVIAEKIAQRDYDKQVIKCAEEWLQWICSTINSMPTKKLSDIYEMSPGRKKIILPYEITNEEYVKQWESISYQGKEFDLNMPEIYTERGERVRSKSEKMIADKLYMLGVPYRYEYPITLEGYGIVYPDFLLLNKKNRKEYILEHFGMMDNSNYSNKAVKKINLYARNGYILGDNFIATFETMEAPLDMREVEKLLCCFL